MDTSYFQDQLMRFKGEGKRLFATSSFQTQSVPLLHLISRYAPEIPVYFLDTGFLFSETLAFKEVIQAQFGLNVIGLRSTVPKIHQLNPYGQLLYVSDPDYCCELNKIKPLEPVLMQYDIWINGVRADQSATRRKMKVFQDAPFDSLRYHPMLSWTGKDIFDYLKAYHLPHHPLDEKGYQSIGCEPCTRKLIRADGERSARWFGLNKTECGLHTDLVK